MEKFLARGKVSFNEKVNFLDSGVSMGDIHLLHLYAKSSSVVLGKGLEGVAEVPPLSCRIERFMGANFLECKPRR